MQPSDHLLENHALIDREDQECPQPNLKEEMKEKEKEAEEGDDDNSMLHLHPEVAENFPLKATLLLLARYVEINASHLQQRVSRVERILHTKNLVENGSSPISTKTRGIATKSERSESSSSLLSPLDSKESHLVFHCQPEEKPQ